MTRDEIYERGTKICESLTLAVAEIAQPGLGSWEPAWDIVGGSDADFMLALSLWEADPNDDTKARVKLTYTAVLDAWRRAVDDYKKNGA